MSASQTMYTCQRCCIRKAGRTKSQLCQDCRAADPSFTAMMKGKAA